MRTYDQLVNDIIHALPTQKEVEALNDEQKQTLRKYGNTFDNVIYVQTNAWKEWRAAHPPQSKGT
jgi:hypothetical protein